MGTPRVALIYPPVTDPTSGYHSLNYIDSYARAQGKPAADIIDANIEAFHYSFSPPGVAWLDRELAKAEPAPYTEQRDAVLGRAVTVGLGKPDPDRVRAAVRTLQDKELFYDYGHYQDAVDGVIAWMDVLGTVGYPGQFRHGFRLYPPYPIASSSAPALTDETQLARVSRPYQPYYDDVLIPRLVAGRYDVVGLTITYQWQLPFALWLAKLIRRALPDAFIIAGGTDVSDIWKGARNREIYYQVFDDFDATVIGEGETAYTDILDSVGAGTVPRGHPNVRLHPRYGRSLALPLRYEPLTTVPVPDFSGLPWDLYLSPERFVYYSPSRGCYWNKCTFCDYGLNTDGPTSPWRQDTADTMLRDVTELSKFAKFIYFSVDVLAPATILRFAEKVVEHGGLDFRWGAEIRLEKYWSPERCEVLRRSGCVAVSVGFESANQRVLDLIDKGTKPAQVKQTITAMTGAGIGVQMMGFTGFPTETVEEATDSVDFLVENRDLWTFGGLGTFVLTPGAIVAKEPERFGVSNIRPKEGADIVRYVDYDEPISQGAQDAVAGAKQSLEEDYYPRPWLGSTDTPHSFFYHDRFGPTVRSVLTEERTRRPGDTEQAFVTSGVFVEQPDERTWQACLQMAHGVVSTDPGTAGGRQLFRRDDGTLFLLNASLRRLLGLFTEPLTLAEAAQHVWMVPPAVAGRVWDTLIGQRLIRRHGPAPVR